MQEEACQDSKRLTRRLQVHINEACHAQAQAQAEKPELEGRQSKRDQAGKEARKQNDILTHHKERVKAS